MVEVKKGDLNLSESEEKIFIEAIEEAKKQKLNIMFVGATGVGKSSTINAIFNTEVAKVGYSVNPETSTIKKYEIDNMILWDTPGLGDSPENDANYAIQIANALKAKDENGNLIVDEVVVLVDGSNRDMGTTYEVIREQELHYENVLFIIFKLIGFYTQVEYNTNDGRIDLVLQTDKFIYIMEFKLEGTAEEALQQINDKHYALPFEMDERKLFKIGVNFSEKTRNIEKWVVE